MKKKNIVLLVLLGVLFIVALMITPRKSYLKDGGTVMHESLFPGIYEVYDYHAMMAGEREFLVGRTVEIFGKEVYNDTKIIKYE